MDDLAHEVPLYEKLLSVPKDACLDFQDERGAFRHIPVGKYCHEAAEHLENLGRLLVEGKEIVEELNMELKKRSSRMN